MDFTKRLALSYYKTITVLNEAHHIDLVQHQSTKKIYVKKVLDVYNLPIYEYLASHTIRGIPRIIEFAEEQGQLTVIEEYISGCSLEEKIEDKTLTAASVIRYVGELCDILEQLHHAEPAIIHRDIKPTNIIITGLDHVVLLDFNAAKFHSEKASSDTVLLGTQGYAAPEQYGFGSSSPKTDIYALGILLREMCSALPDIPDRLVYIAEKCTQIDPDDRFSSMTEIRAELYSLDAPKKSTSKIVSGKRRFLPPGFRSGTPWKMTTAVIAYIIIFWLALSRISKDANGAVLPSGPQWYERICFLLMELSVAGITCDYLHVQRIFQLHRIRQPILRWICVMALDIAVLFFMTLIMLQLEPVFFSG